MQNEQIIDFLNSYNYDIRESNNARWIDQKCTCDVISIIADCILEYTNYDINNEFCISDIWLNKYTETNVKMIFSKPETTSDHARNEYDKFFSQPINFLAYSGILESLGRKGNKNIFKIRNIDLLEYIAMRDTNALNFLALYIQKVLIDSGIYIYFEKFLESQTKDSFCELKHKFIDFTIDNTPINGETECGRIFTKILNPLAFYFCKKGTRKGRLSNTTITLDELKYNRINFRDEISGKDKNLTRQEFERVNQNLTANANYQIQRAKKIVRRYNDKYNNGLSEIMQENELVNATQIHHIFPSAEFPQISDFLENLIALTPNQHFSMAHPNNNTNYIDKDFQYICLLAKTNTIKNDQTGTYNFDDYQYVLDCGLHTNEFSKIKDLDYSALIEKIDCFYSNFNK